MPQTEEHKDRRLLSVFAGMVRTQKAKLRTELETGKLVVVNDDKPARWKAAEHLIETGFAVLVAEGRSFVRKGPKPAAGNGRRRERQTMTLAWHTVGADDDNI